MSSWKNLKKNLLVSLGSKLGAVILRILYLTQRWDYQFSDLTVKQIFQTQPIIMSFWHNQQLSMPKMFLDLRTKDTPTPYVMISKHTDGRLIARTVKYFHIDSVAGSSTDGGKQALLTQIDLVRSGKSAVITPDGPRGPIYKLKRGVVQLAVATGAPIIPIAFSSSSFWQFKSWDKMILPKPFSRGTFLVGSPITAPRELTEIEFLALSDKVETEMNALMKLAGCYQGIPSKNLLQSEEALPTRS